MNSTSKKLTIMEINRYKIYFLFLVAIVSGCSYTENSDHNKLVVTPVDFSLKYYKDYDNTYTSHRHSSLLFEIEFKNNTEDDILLKSDEYIKTDIQYIRNGKAFELWPVFLLKENIVLRSSTTHTEVFRLAYMHYGSLSSALESSPFLNDSIYEIKLPARFDT